MAKEAVNPKIGSFVLETLTNGMYRCALDAIRELVQNGFDSIRAAERDDVIKRGTGKVEVCIDGKATKLTVRDNGLGIIPEEVLSRLANIGMSEKTFVTDAGFRGIGRLAGIAYCRRLCFRTQAAGTRAISSLTFDCDGLRRSMHPQMRGTDELSEIIRANVLFDMDKTPADDHFFEVTLDDLLPGGQVFTDYEAMRAYLSQTAPVDFDTQGFVLASEIRRWAEDHAVPIPKVTLVLSKGNLKSLVYKPYHSLTYTTRKDNHKIDIRGIKFFPEDADHKSPFWLWYGDSNLPGMIDDEVVAGLRLRKSNIALGLDEGMADVFSEVSRSSRRFNSYFVGEVHILDPDVIPNARRDGFEATEAWTRVKTQLVSFAGARSRDVQGASTARNMDTEKLVAVVERKVAEVQSKTKFGLASNEERKALAEVLETQKTKLTSALGGDRSARERAKLEKALDRLARVDEAVHDANGFATMRLSSELDRKQRRIVKEVLELLYQVLEDEPFDIARTAIMNKYGGNQEWWA